MPEATIAKKDDRVVIQRAYRRLLRSLPIDVNEEDSKNIRKAYELAVQAHGAQRRKSGEPYITHPIEVARICADEIGLGPTAIICALLHDVVEDTDVTLEELKKEFGEKITRIVDGLTKLDGAYNANSPQAENFKKVLSTLVDDVRVVLIKMADRLHNLRTIGAMPKHKQLKIAAETNYIYAPLAHRLGLYNIKTEFQDICLRITEPEIFADITKKLQDTKSERQRYIKEFIKPLKDDLDHLNVPYRIIGRPKSISSIWNKMKNKKVSFEEIYDLFAIRIIVDVEKPLEKTVCWQVYSIVTDVHTPIPERLRDWITTPKSNGYESLHTTVIGPKGRYVEVQIRSERMDQIAERGFAAHWKYKGVGGDQNNVFDTWLDNIRELLDSHTDNADAVEFINDFKTNLFNEEVYVYTPNGDLKILPKGATTLDFAFSIHTEIGYQCTAVKVNNKLVPMGYKLQNGDQVKVMTSKNQKPNKDWLKLVVTGKARSKIRSSIKEERRKKGQFGKEALERKFNHLKVDFDSNVEKLVKHLKYQSRLDLFYALAEEDLNLNNALQEFEVEGNQIIHKDELKTQKKEPLPQPPKVKRRKKKEKQTEEARILINGEPGEQYNYKLAPCCNPVIGDDIFAYLTSSSGMKIHRTNCPNATHLMANYGYRIMKAEWIAAPRTHFVVELLITGVDDGPGVIERITNHISSTLGLNIRSFSIEGKEGYFEGKMHLMVKNKDQLNVVVRTLKKLEGISNVTRTN